MELEDEDWIDEGDGQGLGQDDDDEVDEDGEDDKSQHPPDTFTHIGG